MLAVGDRVDGIAVELGCCPLPGAPGEYVPLADHLLVVAECEVLRALLVEARDVVYEQTALRSGPVSFRASDFLRVVEAVVVPVRRPL